MQSRRNKSGDVKKKREGDLYFLYKIERIKKFDVNYWEGNLFRASTIYTI